MDVIRLAGGNNGLAAFGDNPKGSVYRRLVHDQCIDTCRLQFQMLAVIGEFERNPIKERTANFHS